MFVRRLLLNLILVLSLGIGYTSAQTTLSSKEMIAITPVISDGLELDEYSRKALNMKLTQIVTTNGFGATSCRYALVPNVVVIDKQVTATAPAMYSVEFELSLYVVDVVEDIIMSECSFTLKGLDRIESKAFSAGINSLITRSPQMKVFMDRSRTAILDYYTTRTMTLLKKAESLAEQELYDEAMEVLLPIPEEVAEYPLVADAMVVIYRKQLDKRAKTLIQTSRALTSQERYEEAFDALLQVDPASNYWEETKSEIEKLVETVEIKRQEALAAEEAEKVARAKEQLALKEEERKILELNLLEQARAAEANKSVFRRLSESVNSWFSNKFMR